MPDFLCVFCDRRRPADVLTPFCPVCGEPLLVPPPEGRLSIRTSAPFDASRYLDFLPLRTFDRSLSLGEGGTPLQPLDRLGKRFGLPPLYAKNEAVSPTGSFKDRGTVVAVHKARDLGFGAVGTISTGNMAGSTAAYAARAGLKALILVKEDTTREKILAAGVYGAHVVRVRGDYAALFRKSFEIGRARNIYFMNSVDPFRIEGYKVAAFEMFEELGGRSPEFVFVPVSAGGHLLGLLRAFGDLVRAGLVRRFPAFVGVQASGCAPIARAWSRKRVRPSPFPRPKTIAHAIANPDPPGGRLVLRFLAETGGRMIAVSEPEILRAQRLLAEEEGIFCDPAAAVTLAAFLRMSARGGISPRARSILMITGSGLKTLGDLEAASLPIHETDLEGLDRTVAKLQLGD